MPFPWEAVATVGSSLIGGLFGMGSASSSAKQQQKANEMNIAEADKNRNWQAEMRSTEYQTKVEDMRKAGLNPVLAAFGGGGGTPSGAMARVESTGKDLAQNLSLAKLASEIAMNYSAKQKMEAEADRTKASTPEIRSKSNLMSKAYDGFESMLRRTSQATGKKRVRIGDYLTQESKQRLYKLNPKKWAEYQHN